MQSTEIITDSLYVPDDGVDAAHLVADLPGALKAPSILHGKVLSKVIVLGQIGLAVGAVEPLEGGLAFQWHGHVELVVDGRRRKSNCEKLGKVKLKIEKVFLFSSRAAARIASLKCLPKMSRGRVSECFIRHLLREQFEAACCFLTVGTAQKSRSTRDVGTYSQ